MRRPRAAVWAGVGILLFCAAAHAAPPPAAKTEISYLLSTVANSGCDFFRNGTWHDSKAAAAHLTSKLDYLVARDLIQSAEDFIDKAATQSSMSGRAYAIRCRGVEAVPSNQWLRILLARYRDSLEAARKAVE